ncbi:heme oxygenase (decycling) 1 [Mortierella sp. GBA30]|nr:heme oxygenase (decycling) 1 [Mortierella sp. GBA30]
MTLLAVELKESTKNLHAEAGRSKFMKHFFKGAITLEMYGRYLVALYHVYNALEKALDDHKSNPALALIYFPDQLSRIHSLEQDLEFYNGPKWRSMVQEPPSPAQQRYVSAIQECASSSMPERLTAHAYVRYLGDLSGGQILCRRLQKFHKLPENQGIAHYRFEKIQDYELYKDMFRKQLNQMNLTDEQTVAIIEEAKKTFLINMDMFAEFDHELDGAMLTKEEQIEELEALEKEKQKIAAEAEAAKDKVGTTTVNSGNGGILSSLIPSKLWQSLTGTVGVHVDA